ncbi:MAG: C4-dicarboxylate ABC transporter permease, partial [bacterium]
MVVIPPPVGLNVSVLEATLPEVTPGAIFRGVTPFRIAGIFRLAILVFLPGISLLLPTLLGCVSP